MDILFERYILLYNTYGLYDIYIQQHIYVSQQHIYVIELYKTYYIYTASLNKIYVILR